MLISCSFNRKTKLKAIHLKINQAAVILRDETGNTGDQYLCAYVSPLNVDTLTLKQHLSSSLPHYMIPRYIVPMEKLPLSHNGKLDRKILPPPTKSPTEPIPGTSVLRAAPPST